MDDRNIDELLPTLEDLLERREWGRVRELFGTWEEPEIAELIHLLDKRQRVLLFRCLERDRSAEVFSHLDPDMQDALLHELTDAETRAILAGLDPDDRTALLSELPARVTRRLMSLLSLDDLRESRFLLGYPEESIGRLMTPDYVSVYAENTVEEAMARIRRLGHDDETVNRVYIREKTGKLIDDIPLRRLVLAEPGTKVSELMDMNFVSLSAFDDREKAVQMMQLYDVVALPVVDSQGVLIGIVTIDDVMDVAEEETTEDIQKAASVEPLRMSYRNAGVWTLFRKRIVWLVILVMVNLISAGIIAYFEGALQQAIVLTSFIPLLLGTAGNTGAQSATLMLRALVTNDIQIDEWLQSFLKELGVGALLGVALGLLGWALGFVHSGTHDGFQIGIVVGLTMISIVIVANFVGMTLPFVLARAKLDPAVASSPLITTIADATGLLIYFSIATAVLRL